MAVDHAIWAAVPPTGSGSVDKSLLRGTLTTRVPYVLADDDNPEDLVCVDPETGAAILDINYRGRIFHFDPLDDSSEPDGETCIVSHDGRRYKLNEAADVVAYSVIDNSLAAPPDDPSLGDAYLVAAAATGDWVGRDNQVAIWTSRGWAFVVFGIGRLIYVESLEGYYHRKSTGEWVAGFGNQSFEDASIPAKALIGGGGRVHWIVENQTTNTPPAISGTSSWIIGPLPTGRWAGQAGRIAAIEAGVETIYAPSNGWLAFDKARGGMFTFNGVAWVSASGALPRFKRVYVEATTNLSAAGAGYYAYSPSSPPSTQFRRISGQTLLWTALATTNYLRFRIAADPSWSLVLGSGSGNSAAVIGVYVDSEVSPRAWCKLADYAGNSEIPSLILAELIVPASDVLPHNYHFEITIGRATSTYASFEVAAVSRCTITLEELIPS